jgi:hypothetical protein
LWLKEKTLATFICAKVQLLGRFGQAENLKTINLKERSNVYTSHNRRGTHLLFLSPAIPQKRNEWQG